MSLRFLHITLAMASGIAEIDQNDSLMCGRESNKNRNFTASTLHKEIENKFTSTKDKDQEFNLLLATC